MPIAIDHVYGQTTLEAPVQRIATIGWGSFDAAIALGVVPESIGASSFGADADGWLPWTREAIEKMGAPLPPLHDELDGVPYEALSELDPDAILAVNSGISQQEFDTLSKIAPTVAYPGAAWGTPWRATTEMVGRALGKPDDATRLIAQTETTIDDEMARYPAAAGKTALIAWVDAKDLGKVQFYTPNDSRMKYLQDLGLTIAPSIIDLAADSSSFVESISAEQADKLDSDIILLYVQGGELSAVTSDPLLGNIPAVKSGAVVVLDDETQLMAISSPTVLSIPWSLPAYAKAIGEAAAKVG
ncbi:iron-siderophore ABC transporter substrate-binding protein [Sphingomonas sp. BLCC-B65]|nr:iron-siderophore ABC transporter substrate-binding protein [Sphingomonas sp. BLCC-B65]